MTSEIIFSCHAKGDKCVAFGESEKKQLHEVDAF